MLNLNGKHGKSLFRIMLDTLKKKAKHEGSALLLVCRSSAVAPLGLYFYSNFSRCDVNTAHRKENSESKQVKRRVGPSVQRFSMDVLLRFF